uniref:SPARC/Testican calcium-binding domain-containing protein n=1 Tax=Schistocephalus solidus TaxID=70667 RepID=A0A0X3PWT0_SCHSO
MKALLFLALGTMVLIGNGDARVLADEDYENSCSDVKCSMGEYCRKGKCICYDACPSDWSNHQSKVCVDGFTYSHLCDLYRNICYCRNNDPRCGDERYFHGHKATSDSIIRYFAECRDLTTVCNWSARKRYFKYQLIQWFQQLLQPNSRSADSNNVLLRSRDGASRVAADNLLSRRIHLNGSNAGPLLSFWFCELDEDKSGRIEERELAMLTQVAMPTLACLDIFLGNCLTNRIISPDAWLNCFDIDPSTSVPCSHFV